MSIEKTSIWITADHLGDIGDADVDEIIDYLNEQLSESYSIWYSQQYQPGQDDDPVPENIFSDTLDSFFFHD